MPDSSTAPTNPSPADAATRRDPIHDLITRLDRDASTVATKDPDLSRTIHRLADAAGTRPDRVENATFRTRVAYALQDMEKLGGPITAVPQGLREEMGRLALTAPGLQDERLQALMRSTPAMDDARLVRDIRTLANNVGAGRTPENGAPVRDLVDALENRVRLLPSAPGPSSSDYDPRSTRLDDKAAQIRGAGSERAQAARSPGVEASKARPEFNGEPPQNPTASINEQAQPQATVAARGAGVVGLALAALARHAQQENPSWDRQPTSVVDRSARHENAFQQQRDEATIRSARSRSARRWRRFKLSRRDPAPTS